jgi:hypothetical protein
MLTDPETEYRLARSTRDEQVERARRRQELHEAAIQAGLRGAIASALRGVADRVDDAPDRATPPEHQPRPAT